jgi:hypothetical protein
MPVKPAALTVPLSGVTPPAVVRTPPVLTVTVPAVAPELSAPNDKGAVLTSEIGVTTVALPVADRVAACAGTAAAKAAPIAPASAMRFGILLN